jgi:hypothetical protein
MRLFQTGFFSQQDPSDVAEHVTELFTRFYDALNDRNLPTIEKLVRDINPSNGDGPRKIAGFRTSTGRSEIMPELRIWLDSWASYRAEVTEISSSGNQYVVSTASATQLLGSSIVLRSDAADIFVVENGRIESLRLRVNRAAVLRELGLPAR